MSEECLKICRAEVVLKGGDHCRLPNGPALSCAPPWKGMVHPAGGRRIRPRTGRSRAGSPGGPRGGGASAAAPCWAALWLPVQNGRESTSSCIEERLERHDGKRYKNEATRQ